AMSAMGFASLSAWALGHVDSALGRIARAIAFARDDKNPYDLAVGRFFESYLYRWLREPQQAADAATQALAICEEHGFSYYRDCAYTLIGWARAQLGSAGEGASLVRKGLASLAETGARLDLGEILSRLGEAQVLDGSLTDALGTIEDALQANPEEEVV